MPSRRDQIRLSEDGQRELIEGERIVSVATHGPRGWPHVMPIWYVPRDGEVWVYTYGKSQKVRNLERDPRATLMIETGEHYHELRGLMIEADAEIRRGFDTVFQLAQDLNVRYTAGIDAVPDEGKAVLEKQASKRVAIRFAPRRTASWDHRKLGGGY